MIAIIITAAVAATPIPEQKIEAPKFVLEEKTQCIHAKWLVSEENRSDWELYCAVDQWFKDLLKDGPVEIPR